MHTNYVFLPSLAAALVAQGFAQEYTNTNDPVRYYDPDTGVSTTDCEESYVNRTVDGVVPPSAGASIYNVLGAYDDIAHYTGHNVNTTVSGDGVSVISGYSYLNSYTLTADEGTWNTITMTGVNTSLIYTMLENGTDPFISISNTKVISNSGGYLINNPASGQGTTLVVNLSNVNLDGSKNKQIYSYNSDMTPDKYLRVNLSNGTNFDGYASVTAPDVWLNQGIIHVSITSGSSWNVTQDSFLGTTHPFGYTNEAGSVSLDGNNSFISFVSTDGADAFSDDFTNINAAVVMLESGSLLKLDKNAAAFQKGGIITLFTGSEGEFFTNNGALIMTADGQYIDYIDNDNGTFEVRGFYSLIPEPTTATFGLAALSLLALRRRIPA